MEHEVSLQSARNVIDALDKTKYEPILIGIDKDGLWHLHDAEHFLLDGDNSKLIALGKSSGVLSMIPGSHENQIMATHSREEIGQIDVVFPVLHGPYGEDGSIQGLLKLAHIPFVGSGVLGSAIGMDKDVMKRLLRESNIPIADFFAFSRHQAETIDFDTIVQKLGLPFFVKPANLGSSVGISIVKKKAGFWEGHSNCFPIRQKNHH